VSGSAEQHLTGGNSSRDFNLYDIEGTWKRFNKIKGYTLIEDTITNIKSIIKGKQYAA